MKLNEQHRRQVGGILTISSARRLEVTGGAWALSLFFDWLISHVIAIGAVHHHLLLNTRNVLFQKPIKDRWKQFPFTVLLNLFISSAPAFERRRFRLKKIAEHS